MASNNINVTGSNYLPAFHNNYSGYTEHTVTHNDTVSAYAGSQYGGCSAHWGPNVVFNHLESQGLIPKNISDVNICAADINSLKNVINTLISGWTQGGDKRTHLTYFDINEKITSTYITNNAYSDTTITENLWNDVLIKLNIFDGADSINLDSSQIGSYSPTIGTVITRADYNKLVKAIELVAKACKCNSDCACNLVCNCNADCGCNYSDKRLKENIIFLNYEYGLKIYQYNYISDPKTTYKGILAQDLIGTKYECALSLDDDNFYKVDYTLLPIKIVKL